MTANRSLDEFGEAAAEEDGPAVAETGDARPDDSGADPSDATPRGQHAAETEPAPPDEGAGTVTPTEPADVDGDAADVDGPPPVASTYVWSPAGGPCASCGDIVEARWRAGDDLVCPDCKDW